MGGHLLQRTGRTGLGGTGSPAQGVFGASCKADGGGHRLQRTGRTSLGGTGSPAQGVLGASDKTRREPPSCKAPYPLSHYARQQAVGQQYRGS